MHKHVKVHLSNLNLILDVTFFQLDFINLHE